MKEERTGIGERLVCEAELVHDVAPGEVRVGVGERRADVGARVEWAVYFDCRKLAMS